MMVAFKETLGDADLFTHTLKPNHSARHGWKRYHFMLFYSLPKEINPVRAKESGGGARRDQLSMAKLSSPTRQPPVLLLHVGVPREVRPPPGLQAGHVCLARLECRVYRRRDVASHTMNCRR
jgi:hypothetical protein